MKLKLKCPPDLAGHGGQTQQWTADAAVSVGLDNRVLI